MTSCESSFSRIHLGPIPVKLFGSLAASGSYQNVPNIACQYPKADVSTSN